MNSRRNNLPLIGRGVEGYLKKVKEKEQKRKEKKEGKSKEKSSS